MLQNNSNVKISIRNESALSIKLLLSALIQMGAFCKQKLLLLEIFRNHNNKKYFYFELVQIEQIQF